MDAIEICMVLLRKCAIPEWQYGSLGVHHKCISSLRFLTRACLRCIVIHRESMALLWECAIDVWYSYDNAPEVYVSLIGMYHRRMVFLWKCLMIISTLINLFYRCGCLRCPVGPPTRRPNCRIKRNNG